MELREKKIALNGLLINYVEIGTGTPMIFLHNGGGFWHSWEHQILHFSGTHTVYALDWPGFGESQAPNGLISLELLTKTLDAFIEVKQLTEIILIGNCIGGSAALNYSQLYPDKVKALIIFNICPGSLIYPVRFVRKFIPWLNKKWGLKFFVRSLFVFAFTKTPIRRKFPKILFGKSHNGASPLSLRYIEKFKLISQTNSRVNLVFSVHTFNIDSYMHKKEAREHLLVWGSENRVTSLQKHGYYHRDYLQSSEFKVIHNAGHLCMYEKPKDVIELIESYLNKSL